jgi:hypothetical protein
MGKNKNRIKLPKFDKGVKVLPPDTIEINDLKHPVFCFRHTHKDYGISCCSTEQKKELLGKIDQLSKATWEEIRLAHRHGLGGEKIDRSSLNVNPPVFITKDVDHLLAFRFDGKKAMLIHRYRFIMHVIFIDHNFSVYDHE